MAKERFLKVKITGYTDMDNIHPFDYGMGSQKFTAFYPTIFAEVDIKNEKHELTFQPVIDIEDCKVLAMSDADSVNTIDDLLDKEEPSEAYVSFLEENFEDVTEVVKRAINKEFYSDMCDNLKNRGEHAEINVIDIDFHDTLKDDPERTPYQSCPDIEDDYHTAVADVEIKEHNPNNWNEYITARIGVWYAIGVKTGNIFGDYSADTKCEITSELEVYECDYAKGYFETVLDRILDRVKQEYLNR